MEEKPRKKTKRIDNSSPKIDHIPKIDNSSPLDTTTDIVENILQRLPAKSIAKFVTVSKSWVNIIRSNYFIKSFFSLQEFQMQQQPHRLLFAINKYFNFEWSFFSSSSYEEKPQLKFIFHMASKFNECSCEPIYVKGLINFMCCRTKIDGIQIISNPSTGKSIVLPVINGRILVRFFGFDPINNEYKVLCIIGPMLYGDRIAPSYIVLTVGSNSLWRKTDLWIPHQHMSNGVCIDGIIYYLASNMLDEKLMLVRFDVRFEKFLTQLPCLFFEPFDAYLSNLINYKSKLGIAHKPKCDSNSIDLWVLEDAEKDEWLKIALDVSPWRSEISSYIVRVLGTTYSGEIVYTYSGRDGMYYVIYQDDKKKDEYRRVDITPSICLDYRLLMCRIAFIDYVESVMLL